MRFSGPGADCRRQAGPCEERVIVLQVTPQPLSRLRPWTQIFLDLQPILIDFLGQFCLWPHTWLSSPQDHLV